MGAGVVIARYFGAKKYQEVSDAVHTNIMLGLVCGLALTIFGMLFTPLLLKWMNTDPEVLPEATTYFRYYFMGALANVMYSLCQGIMNAVGDSKRPLYYLIFSSVLNIILDILFIGVFGFGVGAAAIATVISQAASMILCLRYLSRKGTVYQIQLSKLRFHRVMLRQIISFGLPSGIQNSVSGFANVIVQSNINTFGTMAMAGYGSYAKIEGFAFLPITSFTMALTTYTGQNLGAKKYDRTKTGTRFGIITTMLIAEVIGVLIFLFSPQLMRMFSANADVISYGVKQARTEALFYFLLAFSHAVASVCRGAGKAFVPMIIMLSIWCVFRITYITLMMHYIHDIRLIYWAYPITWSMSSVIYLLYYRYSDWIHGFESKKKGLQD